MSNDKTKSNMHNEQFDVITLEVNVSGNPRGNLILAMLILTVGFVLS